jgi:hypothetical protein
MTMQLGYKSRIVGIEGQEGKSSLLTIARNAKGGLCSLPYHSGILEASVKTS